MLSLSKLRLLLILPFTVAMVFYLFLVGANYYYASRAAYLLQQIRTLPLDKSGEATLRGLGSEHGFRYVEASNCADSPCLHIVSTDNQWMWVPFKTPALFKVGERLGLRPWETVGDIEMDRGQIVGKIYGLAFRRDSRNYDQIEASAWDERKLEVAMCAYHPLKRHPGYAFMKADNISSFRVLVSNPASEQNRQNAFRFNLNCLTGWHKCDRFSEIMPSAWADYEEDGKWSEANPSWQPGTPCP
ncbi:MAG: hypothetical protein ABSD53_12385 [Terriglobales bacterium]|jgi:hypothetical protein